MIDLRNMWGKLNVNKGHITEKRRATEVLILIRLVK